MLLCLKQLKEGEAKREDPPTSYYAAFVPNGYCCVAVVVLEGVLLILAFNVLAWDCAADGSLEICHIGLLS